MASGIFLERERTPERAELVEGLGDRIVLWDRLAGWIEATYGVAPQPLFYGRDDGWVIRYRRSGKSLVTLIPRRGAPSVLVVIGPSVADRVADLELQARTRRRFEKARAYPDGRWLMVELETEADVDDVRALVALKSPPPRRPRRRDAPPTPAGTGSDAN